MMISGLCSEKLKQNYICISLPGPEGLELASVSGETLSNMNISETSRPITTKFYLSHWDGVKVALGWARSDQNSGWHGNR